MDFELDPRLEADTWPVIDWPLCRVLLMNDAHYPWLILVPRVAGLVNLHDLDASQAAVLTGESRRASRVLAQVTGAEKTNVAMLGNLVPQFHVHVIARFESDHAWPGPVWGAAPALPYGEQALQARVVEMRSALS